MHERAKDLLKVLFGIAWIDGEISEAESFYLNGLAYKRQLNTDPEIQELLRFERPIGFGECLNLLSTYLDGDRSEESYNEMVKEIRSLVQSDGVITSEEAAFLQVSGFLRASIEHPELARELEACRSLPETVALAKRKGYAIDVDIFKEAQAEVEMEQKLQVVASAYLDGDEAIGRENLHAARELVKSMLGLDLKFRVESVWVPMPSEAAAPPADNENPLPSDRRE